MTFYQKVHSKFKVVAYDPKTPPKEGPVAIDIWTAGFGRFPKPEKKLGEIKLSKPEVLEFYNGDDDTKAKILKKHGIMKKKWSFNGSGDGDHLSLYLGMSGGDDEGGLFIVVKDGYETILEDILYENKFSDKIIAKFLTDKERAKLNLQKALQNRKPQRLSEKPEKIKDYLQLVTKEFTPSDEKYQEHRDWIDIKALNTLVRRGGPEIERIFNAGGKEPYQGNFDGLEWTDQEISKFYQPIKVRDLQGTLGKDVPSGGADPLSWADSKYRVSYNLLLEHHDKPLTIHTRSDLISHDDYLEVLDTDMHKVNMHVLGTFDKRIHEILERSTPSLKRRLDAVKKLADHDVHVTVVIDELHHPDMPQKLADMLHPDLLAIKRVVGPKVKIVRNKINLSTSALNKILKKLDIVKDAV